MESQSVSMGIRRVRFYGLGCGLRTCCRVCVRSCNKKYPCQQQLSPTIHLFGFQTETRQRVIITPMLLMLLPASSTLLAPKASVARHKADESHPLNHIGVEADRKTGGTKINRT